MKLLGNMEKKQIKTDFEERFKYYSGHNLENFKSFNQFAKWLHRPVASTALGVFRILFGLIMLIDIAEERGGSQIDVRFGDTKTCHFPLFNFIRALSLPAMGIVYLIMWFGALGIALGYKFKFSCFAFAISYWYIFLLDKPTWNNHSYLFGLCGILLMTTNANYFCSLDARSVKYGICIPYWNYFLIKFQFFILYTYAGLKKFSIEWLSGYAMSNLSHHWVFTPFRTLLSGEMTDLLIIHWFTAVFDFSIAFFMTFESSRIFALPFMISFHLINSRLFTIGMFPWVCLAEVTLFFGSDWPHEIHAKFLYGNNDKKENYVQLDQSKDAAVSKFDNLRKRKHCHLQENTKTKSEFHPPKRVPPISRIEKIRTLTILLYCCVQLFLPYSHFITKGYNNWTKGLYGYSWDMMVHSYDTVLISIKIMDNNNGNVHYLEPFAFTQYDRWTKSADMAVQYAKCINENIITEMEKNPAKSPLSSTNISIFFDIWCSMNGRFQQRVFDPRVDLLRAQWSPFKQTPWSLPLLNELNYMRPQLKTIADEVLSWNNYSDVVFVADFPGLTLENFVSPDLSNVTLKIIEGSVNYKLKAVKKHLTSGQSISPPSGATHHVTTTSSQPSCYLYTYINKTMETLKVTLNETDKEILPLKNEFIRKIKNYKKFLHNILNILLFIVYGLPIPVSLREL